MLNAREKQLRDHFDQHNRLKNKDSTIREMKDLLQQAVTDAQKKGVTLNYISKHVEELNTKHKLNLDMHMTVNIQSDKEVRVCDKRTQAYLEQLREMAAEMRGILAKSQNEDLPRMTSSFEINNKVITPQDRARFTLSVLLRLYCELQRLTIEYYDLKENVEYVVNITKLGDKTYSVTDVRETTHLFVADCEGREAALRTELAALKKEVHECETEAHSKIQQKQLTLHDCTQRYEEVLKKHQRIVKRHETSVNERERLQKKIDSLEEMLRKVKFQRPSQSQLRRPSQAGGMGSDSQNRMQQRSSHGVITIHDTSRHIIGDVSAAASVDEIIASPRTSRKSSKSAVRSRDALAGASAARESKSAGSSRTQQTSVKDKREQVQDKTVKVRTIGDLDDDAGGFGLPAMPNNTKPKKN